MSKVAITGNASGAGVFTIASPDSATDQTLTLPDETGTILVGAYMHVRDEKASGTGGGASVVGWNTRTLNTVVTNTITGASLATNQITLSAGTYRISSHAPGYAVNHHRLALYNVTDSSYAVLGTVEYANITGGNHCRSFVDGQITIAGTKVFDLRQEMATANGNGFGLPTTDGHVEVYAVIEIERVG